MQIYFLYEQIYLYGEISHCILLFYGKTLYFKGLKKSSADVRREIS